MEGLDHVGVSGQGGAQVAYSSDLGRLLGLGRNRAEEPTAGEGKGDGEAVSIRGERTRATGPLHREVGLQRRERQRRGSRRPRITASTTTSSDMARKYMAYGNRRTSARRVSPWTRG